MTNPMPSLSDMPNWPRLLSEEQAAAYVGVSRNTFRGMVGSLWPEPVPGFGRRRLYDKEALDKAVDGISLTESESLTIQSRKTWGGDGTMIQVVRLRHVKKYQVGGRVYWYHRITKERLPDDERQRVARVLHINETLENSGGEVVKDVPRKGSLGDLILKYQASPEFRRLAPATKDGYRIYLDLIGRTVGTMTVTNIDSAWLYRARDSMSDRPAAADMMLSVMSILLNYAVTRGFRQDNPATHVKKLRAGKSYEAWPDVAIERFRAEANPRMVWAMELAIHTGQRRGDVLAMQWRHIEQRPESLLISVTQQKTGERLLIPIHPRLADVLESIPRVGTNIVHREDGRAYTGSGFSALFRREQQRLGLGGLQFHGLRHTAAARLAEAGCTDSEIMSILGHRTASMVRHYTRGANQERLSQSAMSKVTNLESRKEKR